MGLDPPSALGPGLIESIGLPSRLKDTEPSRLKDTERNTACNTLAGLEEPHTRPGETG